MSPHSQGSPHGSPHCRSVGLFNSSVAALRTKKKPSHRSDWAGIGLSSWASGCHGGLCFPGHLGQSFGILASLLVRDALGLFGRVFPRAARPPVREYAILPQEFMRRAFLFLCHRRGVSAVEAFRDRRHDGFTLPQHFFFSWDLPLERTVLPSGRSS